MENYAKLSDYGIRPTKDLIDKIGIYSRKYGIDQYYIKMALVKCNSQKVNNHVIKFALGQKEKDISEKRKAKEQKEKEKKEKKARKKKNNNPKEEVRPKKYIHKSVFEENVKFYKKYIRSDAWRLKRLEAIKHHGQDCQQCGHFLPMSMIQVHHITYKRVGKELMEDLMIVCRSCHEKIHGIHKESELDMNQ